MSEAVRLLASWQTWVVGLIVFYLLPGFVNRVLVACYPPDDPDRAEMYCEFYKVPVHRRPGWLCQQVEVAVCEGLAARWQARRERRKVLEAVRVSALATSFEVPESWYNNYPGRREAARRRRRSAELIEGLVELARAELALQVPGADSGVDEAGLRLDDLSYMLRPVESGRFPEWATLKLQFPEMRDVILGIQLAFDSASLFVELDGDELRLDTVVLEPRDPSAPSN